MRVQDYSWYDLANGPYKIKFQSNGRFQRWDLKLTASGVETEGSFEVYLDETPLNWTTSGLLDRSTYEVCVIFAPNIVHNDINNDSTYQWHFNNGGLSSGQHTLEFRQGYPPKSKTSPIRQLCSVTLHEYEDEPHYHFDNNYYGAFPSYDINNRKSYRPTHEC